MSDLATQSKAPVSPGQTSTRGEARARAIGDLKDIAETVSARVVADGFTEIDVLAALEAEDKTARTCRKR